VCEYVTLYRLYEFHGEERTLDPMTDGRVLDIAAQNLDLILACRKENFIQRFLDGLST
jgi:hypothetical protein